MAAPSHKRRVFAVITALAVLSAAAAAAVWDPARKEIEVAFTAYLGDLKTLRSRSAALRIFPTDLVALKRAALDRASQYPDFRDETLKFMQVREAVELAAVPKERFFEFLLERTFTAHPEVHSALSQGTLAGMHIRREGQSASVDAAISVSSGADRRYFTMHVEMVRADDQWLVRL